MGGGACRLRPFPGEDGAGAHLPPQLLPGCLGSTIHVQGRVWALGFQNEDVLLNKELGCDLHVKSVQSPG